MRQLFFGLIGLLFFSCSKTEKTSTVQRFDTVTDSLSKEYPELKKLVAEKYSVTGEIITDSACVIPLDHSDIRVVFFQYTTTGNTKMVVIEIENSSKTTLIFADEKMEKFMIDSTELVDQKLLIYTRKMLKDKTQENAIEQFILPKGNTTFFR